MTTPDYSTTRRLTHEKPICFDSSVDGFSALLKTPDSDQKIAEGGLRLQGLFKVSREDRPLITVVTVVYNGVDFLEDTIKSVLEQTYDNVEYIIVDGGSQDGTLDIIQRYDHAIDYWVSERDKGIYDAMNKAISLGVGAWINFMNAGDSFFDQRVISTIFDNGKDVLGCDVIYGDHEVRYPNKTRVVKAGRVEDLWKGSQFCHQSAFVSLGYHKKNKFNIQRKIAADFEFFYRAHRSGSKMIGRSLVFSRVDAGGVSDRRRVESILERLMCLDKSFFVVCYYACLVVIESAKSFVKKHAKIKH